MPILDLLHKSRYAPPATTAARRAVCSKCPQRTRLGRCLQCGCFTNLKTKLATEACPIGKWAAVAMLLLLLHAGVVGQSFTAPFSIVTSDNGVDIYHVPVAINITADEILIGKKGSDMDVLFAHILDVVVDTTKQTVTYTTEQGRVVYSVEGDCQAVTFEGEKFTWRLYSNLPEWVQVKNK